MIRARVTLAVFSLVLVTVLSGCEQTSPAASSQTPPGNLAVGDHFSNLWFAGRAENWPLADFYLGETKSHLRWAVRRIPIRKDNRGQDINLGNILEAFENSQLAQLKRAVDGKDRAAFEAVSLKRA